MNDAIKVLQEKLGHYDGWYEAINDEIRVLENRIEGLKQERTELLTKVESLNEAIWKLQNDPR